MGTRTASRAPRKPAAKETAIARSLLVEGLSELSLELDRERVDALMVLAALLERWSQRINLTGHRGIEAIIRRLVLDAAALSKFLPDANSVADLGSGAGFPAFPLAILDPDRSVCLVEAREKRHHFQRAVARELGLANVNIQHGRAENIDPHPAGAVIAQAVARPAAALPWMLSWVAPGGLLLLPGSEIPPEVPEIPGVSPLSCERYRVPCGGPQRTVWIGRAVP